MPCAATAASSTGCPADLYSLFTRNAAHHRQRDITLIHDAGGGTAMAENLDNRRSRGFNDFGDFV
jgi:hypothetical protein